MEQWRRLTWILPQHHSNFEFRQIITGQLHICTDPLEGGWGASCPHNEAVKQKYDKNLGTARQSVNGKCVLQTGADEEYNKSYLHPRFTLQHKSGDKNPIVDIPKFGEVRFHQTVIANILPLACVKDKFHVTYDSRVGNNFVLHKYNEETKVFE